MKQTGLCVLAILFFLWNTAYSQPRSLKSIAGHIGDNDSFLIADPHGKIIASKHEDKKRVPASTFKLLTALAAIHYLGQDFRFHTEFYLDQNTDLKIKGYGDPFLVSEIIDDITKRFAITIDASGKGGIIINDIILDDSYFQKDITIPGKSVSIEPYDAPNGALCANFNTVYFKKNDTGKFISAEPQTPLLPFVYPKIKAASLDSGRIMFTNDKNEITLYAGYLFQYFLNKNGVRTSNKIKIGRVNSETDHLILNYSSPVMLSELISKLIEYSNNFTANQIFIALGAHEYGPPGTLGKGIQAVSTYAKNTLGINDIDIAEGSGLSRENRVSAKSMLTILNVFEPYHTLMRHDGNDFYKTGTLSDIKSRMGYIETKDGKLYRYVILLNTPGKTTEQIMDIIYSSLE